jgi:membrane associated rhomboid family serine protease
MYRPSGFNVIPPVIKNLIIINALVYLASFVVPHLGEYLGLYFPGSPNFRPYQFITYMFTHEQFFHFFFNMFSLWMIGSSVEMQWGPKRFLMFYFVCGLGAAVIHYTVFPYLTKQAVLAQYPGISATDLQAYMHEYMAKSQVIGASGAIYGILIAFGFLFPNTMLMMMFPPIPMKAKYFVGLMVALDLFAGISGSDNVAHFAHLGGALVAFIILLYWKQRGKLYGDHL